MLGVGRAADVDGGKNGEDVGLQESDQDFEAGQKDQHEERQDAANVEERLVGAGLEHCLAEQGERDQQNVAGEHVGEESDRQRERADDDGREELDQANEWLQRRGNTWWPQHVPEICTLLVLQTGPDEYHPDEQGKKQRDGDTRRRGHLQNWDDPGQVAQIDKHEQAEQERCPFQALFAHGLHDHAVFDELDRGLRQVTDPGRCDLVVFAARQQEDNCSDRSRKNSNKCNLVERREQVTPTKDLVDFREFESEHGGSVPIDSSGRV